MSLKRGSLDPVNILKWNNAEAVRPSEWFALLCTTVLVLVVAALVVIVVRNVGRQTP